MPSYTEHSSSFVWLVWLFCYFETEFLWLSLAGLELIP